MNDDYIFDNFDKIFSLFTFIIITILFQDSLKKDLQEWIIL